MMQMLQQGGVSLVTDGIRQADDDNPNGYFELEAVKRTKSDGTWLKQAADKAVKVIYKLLYDLPEDCHYQVILMRRPISEVIASQSAMLDRKGSPGAAISQTRLAEIFSRQLDEAVHFLSVQPHFELLEVNYHDVLHEPLVVSKAVAKFLHRSLDLSAMASAVDTSLYRRKEK